MFASNIVSSHSVKTGWLLRYLIPCPFKKLTGFDCPGCGFQRSVIALMRGELVQSFTLYPATLLLLSILLFALLNNKFKFANYGVIKKWLLVACALVIASSYLIKIANLYL